MMKTSYYMVAVLARHNIGMTSCRDGVNLGQGQDLGFLEYKLGRELRQGNL